MIPLDRLLMARDAGETRPVGSASIDRLRQIAAAWHRAVHVDSSMIPVHICDLDAVLADVSAERTRASAAEAECARLTTERDAARAEAAGLRAVVEGRTVPPTPQEIAAHHDASGSGWLVSSDRDVIPYTLCRSEARDGGAPDGARWWPLDASGRPCPWPTVALDAAGEGR